MIDPARAQASESRVFKAVFPGSANHHNTLFGGMALQWMDEIAFIAATRYTRMRLVTVSLDKVAFSSPILSGMLLELVATVVEVGRSSIKVQVDVFSEDMYSHARQKAISGITTLVAVDEAMKPAEIQ